MAYISNEVITGNGSDTEFTLDNDFKAGTLLISYNGKLFYEWKEKSGGSDDDKVVFDYAPLSTDTITASYYTITEPSTLNATRYSTVRQINALSRVSSLVSSSDASIEKIIREAEGYIDSIVGGWSKYYPTQNNSENVREQLLTFPRVNDYTGNTDEDYPGIPRQISQACLYAVENIYLKGTPSSPSTGEYQSEKLGDYSYTLKNTDQGLTDYAISMIGTRSMAILRGFITRMGTIDLDKITNNYNTLNSRAKFIKR